MSASPRILRNFVNGDYVEPESDATSDIISPVTAKVVATAPVSSAAEVDRAYAAAAGLASSVWTKDFGRAMRMSRKLDFGCVWINTHIPIVAEMPHGGFKHSGYGKDLSMYGFEDYTRIKHVMANIEERS